MNPLPDSCLPGKKSTGLPFGPLFASLTLVVLGLLLLASGARAQSLTWSDSFVQGKEPSEAQCQNWSAFLDQLQGRSFAAVTISGEFDPVGKTLSDPASVTALANLLAGRTAGTVEFDGQSWTVTQCDVSICQTGWSIALSVNGDTQSCNCDDEYAIRPQSRNSDWGGINTGGSCNARSQSMKLEFHSGVSIIAEQSTTLCEGREVILTAKSIICTPPHEYLWSNGATTQSILVTEPGDYSVTVSNMSGDCSGTSAPFTVRQAEVSVNAGEDVTYCDTPVLLNAVGSSVGDAEGSLVNEVCMFDSPGMIGQGMCNFITDDVCLEGTTAYGNTSFSKMVSFANPVELRFNLYYSADWYTTFIFKLNGKQIDSYYEGDPTSACDVIGEKAPRTIVISADKFREHWLENSDNTLTVDIVTEPEGIRLAGLVAEVVTSNEFYNWAPAIGLTSAFIPNPSASPEDSQTYTVTYTDANGCIASDEIKVNVQCTPAPPVATCQEVTVALTEGCEAGVSPVQFYAGEATDGLTFTADPPAPYPAGRTEVTLIVADAHGQKSQCTTFVNVVDGVLPEVSATDIVVNNDPGLCSAIVDLQLPKVSDNCSVKSISHDYEGNAFPAGETIVTWTVIDNSDNVKTASQKVTVVNTLPAITSVVASATSVSIGSPVKMTIIHADDNLRNATINWGDESATETIEKPEEEFEIAHIYEQSGSYSVTITVTDECDKSAYTYQSIVVFNDQRGTASGGGWYESPRGAYLKDKRASGKASFSFDVSNTGGNEPTGNITFNFKNGKIKFRSSYIQWLNVGEKSASMKAVGRLNGVQDYQILIAVLKDVKDEDGSGKGSGKKKDKADKNKAIDRIRVKIWDPTGKVIYDTQMGEPDEAPATTPLGGGSIDVEKQKTDFRKSQQSPVASSFGGESSSVYPNPFTDHVDVQFNTGSQENVVILVLDLAGKVIYNQVFAVSEDGHYGLEIFEGDEGTPGIYIVVIKQGRKVEFLRLVKE